MKHELGYAARNGDYYQSCKCGWEGRRHGPELKLDDQPKKNDWIVYLLHVTEAMQEEIEEIRYRTDASRLGF
jgi:hypothetical protein